LQDNLITAIKMAKRKSQKQERSLKILFLKWSFIGALWCAIGVALLMAYFAIDLPDVKKLHENVRLPNITVLDRDGEVIATAGNLYGDYVSYKEFPKTLIDAVTSIEDRRFFSHFGVDPLGLLRAAFVNYRAGYVVQGGSTITQQLAKVVFLDPERTLKRKVQEVMLALYLEHNFTKEEIITMYLNRIYLGSGNYGVDAASRTYFGKKISEINLYESAMIAGLIKAPSLYSPANNFKLAKKRTNQVLAAMVDNEVLKPDYKVTGVPKEEIIVTRRNVKSKDPYFVDWVKEQLTDYIGEENGEIIVSTTIDSKLQKLAEDAVAKNLTEGGTEHNVSQAAMVVLSPKGEVLAMVGGKSYGVSQFNRVTQAYRQPGSAFKLFVYLAAMENGYTPDDTMVDEPIKIDGWTPENWNNKFVGEVTLRDALANSINTISIKLAKSVGIRKVLDVATRLGITSEMNNDLTSALGTSEVSLLELTGAYASLANYGNAVWVHGITKINDSEKKVMYERQESEPHRVISMDTTAEMNEMLINVVNNGTGKRAQMGYPVAGKTGTSQNSRDAWFIGYTGNMIAGVWVGNDDNTPMKKVGGGGMPAGIWKDFMVVANAGKDVGDLPTSANNVSDGETNSNEAPEEQRGHSIWDSIIKGFGGGSDDEAPKPYKDSKPAHETNTDQAPDISNDNTESEEVILGTGSESESRHDVNIEYKYPGSGR
jgi:penicillin-binding protein 1A